MMKTYRWIPLLLLLALPVSAQRHHRHRSHRSEQRSETAASAIAAVAKPPPPVVCQLNPTDELGDPTFLALMNEGAGAQVRDYVSGSLCDPDPTLRWGAFSGDAPWAGPVIDNTQPTSPAITCFRQGGPVLADRMFQGNYSGGYTVAFIVQPGDGKTTAYVADNAGDQSPRNPLNYGSYVNPPGHPGWIGETVRDVSGAVIAAGFTESRFNTAAIPWIAVVKVMRGGVSGGMTVYCNLDTDGNPTDTMRVAATIPNADCRATVGPAPIKGFNLTGTWGTAGPAHAVGKARYGEFGTWNREWTAAQVADWKINPFRMITTNVVPVQPPPPPPPPPPPAPPAVPAGLTAAAGDARVTLSWSTVAGATGYIVQRATAQAGPFSAFPSLPGTTYTDAGLTNGTAYWYEVAATGVGGTSAFSDPVKASPAGQDTGYPANYVVPPPAVPIPPGAATDHPRLLFRSADIPTLRSWAVPSNEFWGDMTFLAGTAKNLMDTGHVPQDDSGDGDTSGLYHPVETFMQTFAFMSVIDPDPIKRADWQSRAHTLLMYVMNQAVTAPVGGFPITFVNGVRTIVPFCTPKFATGDRSRYVGDAYGTTVDWIYSSLTAQDKATIRKVFLRWVQENQTAQVTHQEHPIPTGVFNDPALLADTGQLYWSANNYYCNHARQVTLMALAMDPADDVPNPSIGDNIPAGTLTRWIGGVIGSYLYQRDYLEQHKAAGGISPEGTEYGSSSIGGIATVLALLRVAGYDDLRYGPAANLSQRPYWQTEVPDSFLHSTSPTVSSVPGSFDLVYWLSEFGDIQTNLVTDEASVFNSLLLIAIRDGDVAKQQKLQWIQDNTTPGGVAKRTYRLHASLGGSMLWPILYYVSYSPTRPAPVDPRGSIGSDWWAPGIGRVLSRTSPGWTIADSWFTFVGMYIRTDHQNSQCGGFELWRKGEWLTKKRTGYGWNVNGADYANTLSLETTAPSSSGYALTAQQNGSQYPYVNNGDPTTTHSFAAGYTFAQTEMTDLYNTSYYHSVSMGHVSRSVFWIKPDFIVAYDRITSLVAGRYKRFFFNTQNLATVAGNVVTAVTPHGQQLFATSLLPVGATINPDWPVDANDLHETANNEMMRHHVAIEDVSHPNPARFLTVLQGADAGASPAACSTITSTAGDSFVGALANGVAAMFKDDITATFTTTTFQVPTAGTTAVYISGLVPGATYTVAASAVGPNTQYVVTPGGPLTADGGGVVQVRAAAGARRRR